MPTPAISIHPTPTPPPSPNPATPPNLSPISAELLHLHFHKDSPNEAQDAPANDERAAMGGASEDATSSPVPSFRFVREVPNSAYESESIPDPNTIDFDTLAEDKRAPVPSSFAGSDRSILEALNGWDGEGECVGNGEMGVGGEEVNGGKKVEEVKEVKKAKKARKGIETKGQSDLSAGSDSCELQFDMENI